MKKICFTLALLLFLSCRERVFKETNFTFQLPEKEVFVKTSKRPGGKFVMFFALDSLSLINCQDSIEFKTNDYIHLMVNVTDVYARSDNSTIQSIGENKFNIEVATTDSTLSPFFENGIQKYPYSYINIDPREYGIAVNQVVLKEGDMYGGWQK